MCFSQCQTGSATGVPACLCGMPAIARLRCTGVNRSERFRALASALEGGMPKRARDPRLASSLLRGLVEGGYEPDSEPAQVYGSNQVELAWTVIPILIVVVLFLASARVITFVQSAQHREKVSTGSRHSVTTERTGLSTLLAMLPTMGRMRSIERVVTKVSSAAQGESDEIIGSFHRHRRRNPAARRRP